MKNTLFFFFKKEGPFIFSYHFNFFGTKAVSLESSHLFISYSWFCFRKNSQQPNINLS